ncbi:MAG TPA: M56 family metallopeptidase [Streptosporangiaceae bacterium]|nr:M56 family metallopeptidase [Streptosporangiaceae bacterium]
MTGAILLAAYAGATGAIAPAALRRGWSARAPRFAIALWLVLSLSWVAAAATAIVTVTAPARLSWPGSRAAAMTLPAHAAPGPAAVSAAGLLLAAAVLARACGCVAFELARARRQRRAHAAFLQAEGRPDHALGAVVLDDEAPAAYCLPAGRHRIVITAGTRAALRPAQVQAVLAHERAHLRGRHHLLLATATATSRAFPFVPLLAQAGAQVSALAEMAADDAATRRHDPGDLAAALVILATAGTRAAALAASGPGAAIRIHRLLAPPPAPGRPARTTRLAAAAGTLALPAAVACLPLLAAACDVSSRL